MKGSINIKSKARQSIQITVSGISILLSLLVVLLFLLTLGSAISPMVNKNETIQLNNLFSTIVYTFKQSIISTLLSVILGFIAAYFISNYDFMLKRFLLSLSSIPLCMPSLIIALGYIATFGINGVLNRILVKVFNLTESPLTFLYSFWGIVITQGFYNMPLVMSTISESWSSITKDEEEAACILGSSRIKTFTSITLYKLLPSIMSSAILSFLFCFFSFMIVLLFGTPGGTTLEVAIYHAGKSTLKTKNAALLSLIETLCALITVLLYSLVEQKSKRSKGKSFNNITKRKNKITKQSLPFFIIFILIIITFLLVPLFSIIVLSFTKSSTVSSSFTLNIWIKLFKNKGFIKSLFNTLYTGLLSSALSTLIALTVSILYAFLPAKNSLLKTLPMLPMAVSSVVLGIGITYFIKSPTILSLILCQSFMYWPFAFRQISPSLDTIRKSTIDSSLILSKYKTDIVFNIMIPEVKKNILSSFGFCFALSAGDSTIPLLLSLRNFDTLSLFTYRLASSYKTNMSCASGLILSLLCMTVFLISSKFKEKK